MFRTQRIAAIATALFAAMVITLQGPAVRAAESETRDVVLPPGTAVTMDNINKSPDVPWLNVDEVERRRYGHYAVRNSKDFAGGQIPKAARTADIWTECLARPITIGQAAIPWVRDHYAMCARGLASVGHVENGDVKWSITVPYTVVGIGSKLERAIDVNLKIHTQDIQRSSSAPADPVLKLELFCKDLNFDSDPTAAKTCQVDNQPAGQSLLIEKRLSEWSAAPEDYAFRVTSSDSDASWTPVQKSRGGPEKVVVSNLGMNWHYNVSTSTPQGAKGWQTSVRFDTSDYLKYQSTEVNATGAVFYDIIPSIEYRRNDTAVSEVAKHIWDAFVNPGITKPVIPAGGPPKVIPGASNNVDDTIQRLYWNDDNTGRNDKRIDENRSKAVAECKLNWGDPLPIGHECDEFPFATTYQGAAGYAYHDSPRPLQWSARSLPATDNREAGKRLNAFYSHDRILDWSYIGRLTDDFFVRVS